MANDIQDLAASIQELRDAMLKNTETTEDLTAKRMEQSGAQKGVSTKAINRLAADNATKLDQLATIQESGLAALTQRLTEEKESIQFDLSVSELGNKLDRLNSLTESNETSEGLKVLFEDAVRMLENPKISDDERALIETQIDALGGLAADEEETREARKLQEEANSRLSQMAAGLEGVAGKFDEFSSNFGKGASLLGTLGAIGLLLFDPETLKDMVIGVIEFFEDMYATVQALLDGDWTTAFGLMKENLKGIGIAIGAIAVFFGGTIIRSVASVLKTVKSVGSMLGKVGKLFGKFFLPITIILGAIGAVTGFIKGFQEGGIVEGLKQGLTGLFDALIGAPLNLLKDGVAWILGKLGFENAAETLGEFDFTTMFSSMINALFSGVSSAIDWIKGAFGSINIGESLSALFSGIVGEGGLVDIMFAPIDAAINWVMGMFGFEAPEEGFSLREMIGTVIENVKNFFIDLFDFLPSIDSIKESITNLLPDWLKPDEEINIATANEEQLRAMAKDNAGFFGDEDEEYEKLVAEKQAAMQTQLDTTPKEFVDSKMEDSQANEILKRTPKEFIQQTQTEAAENSEVLAAGQQVLDTRPSDYISKLEKTPGVLDKQKVMNENEAAMKAAAAAPIIINNNNSGGKGGNSTNNVSSATYNISQGISADDFVKADFANRY